MRIRALGLERYGAFENRRVEFGPGLTLVVGANEAGKSTTLDALADLLWAFRGTRQSFHFGLGALSLTAELELPGRPGGPDAGRVEVRRRNTGLQTVADGAVFTPPWGPGGAEERRRWSRAFGLSHSELREGGAAVFAGSGDLAELVFTARSGRAVRGLLEALTAEMDGLYKAHRNSRTSKLRTALADYERRAEQAASSMTRAAHVDDARRELALRRAAAETTAGTLRAAAQHRDRLEQRVRAAGHVRDLVVLRERRAALLAAGTALTAEQAAVFDTNTGQITTAEAELSRLGADLLDRRAARETLTVDEAVLADGAAITRLDRACVARLDDDRRARELAAESARQSELARTLLLDLVGPNDGRDAAGLLDHLHVPRDLAAQLDALAAALTDLRDELRRAEDSLAAARRRHEDATELSPGADPLAISRLKAVVDAVSSDGSATALARDAIAAAAEATRERRAAQRRAGALDPDGPPPAIPGRGEVRLARERLEDAEAVLARREEELVGATRDLDLAEGRLAEADERDVPDQAALEQARATRTELWNLLVTATATGPAAPGLTGERARELLPVLAAGIARADEVADQLIRHADLAARRGQLRREAATAQDRVKAALATTAAAAGTADQARAAWETLWRQAGLAVPAREDADDVQQAVEEAHRAHEELLAAQARLRGLDAQAQAQRTALAEALALVGAAPGQADPDSLLGAARGVLEEDDRAREQRVAALHLGRAVEDAERDRDKRRSELDGAEREWRELVHQAGLTSATDPRGWAERRAVLTEATALHEQALRAGRDAAEAAGRFHAFAVEVSALASRHGLLGPAPAADAATPAESTALAESEALADLVEQLSARYRASSQGRARATEIDHAIAGLTGRITETTRLRDVAAAQLDELRAGLELAPGQTLADAAARHRDLAHVTAELAAVEVLLRATAPAEETEVLVSELAGRTDDDLQADLARAREDHDRHATAHSDAWTSVGTVERHLRDLESGASAGELHARAQESLALVAETAERYVIARIQHETLSNELAAYERRHASPLLADAGQLLERLTEGRYVALRAVDRGDGARTLRVVRSDEHELGPKELSEGTCDQVYLALRLAAIAQLQRERADRGEPTLPVVLDDVLMTFDDERATAALRVLAEFAPEWQIILLTHHEHLTDLARAACGGPRAGENAPDGECPPGGESTTGGESTLTAAGENLVTITYLPGANALAATRRPDHIRAVAGIPAPAEPGDSALTPVVVAGGGASPGTGGNGTAGRDPGRIRGWARRNGFDVGDRGRIPREIVEAFEAAHAG
ncbi:hypothetical protein UG55_1006130 [Frankia sp. EI5c]|uniref:AAA family ATPase n=1 Tax=Frankia sp. EI5c TaxID=683316 RepID=UPI0007C24083|nr:histone-like nucleoid-structuring protein Lsr2 [Frankia sp. EI5c]OAA28157.1 hypothetical protein UG55_1006130 [Frankia sp. EI5c]